MPRATNICCAEACDLESLPDNTVLISINEEAELHKLKLDRQSSKVFTTQFSDVCADVEYKTGQFLHPISEKQTYELLGFIERNKAKNFIVHCHAGVSRSSAVCLFLHIKYGHVLRDSFWRLSHPNRFVLGSLFICDKQPIEHSSHVS